MIMSFTRIFLFISFIICLSSYLFSQENTSEDEFKAEEGKIIRKIEIRRIDISGPSVDENEPDSVNWWGNLVNSIHYKTRPWVVKNWLLFNKGDRLDSKELSDSERLLRSSGFFLDARIKTRNYSKDSVDVLVITKDKWTISVLASYDTDNKNAYVGFRDENLIGIGHNIDATVTKDEEKSIGWGASLNYTAANIGGSFIDADVLTKANKKLNIESLSLSRSFVTTETEFVGGMSFVFEHNHLQYINSFNENVSVPYTLNSQDVWLGHTFPVFFGSKLLKIKPELLLRQELSEQIILTGQMLPRFPIEFLKTKLFIYSAPEL